MSKFLALGLSKPTTVALQEISYTEPTEIQEKAIPLIMSGRDIMASAETGSGKTAAFALPLIESLKNATKKPKILVLVPTRELALQVEEQFKRFGRYSQLRTVTLYGGTSYENQRRILERGTDIIVATPGRLLDCMERRSADLSQIEKFVMDEADRLLDMGFMPQIRRIVAKLPKARQTLMFSATIDRRIERLAAEYLIDPVTVRINGQQVEPKAIAQQIYHVTEFGKDALLLKLINELKMNSVLVFTRTKRKASWVRSRLRDSNVQAEEIHGDISQHQRERTLAKYKKGLFTVLVATDVAARGLDIPSISHVINYDLPDSPEAYVHRIGRTGRAGRSGVALSFVSEEQRYLIRDIEKTVGCVLDPNGRDHREHKVVPSRRFRSSRRRIG